MRSLFVLMSALLIAASAQAGPTQTGPVALSPSGAGRAVSALGVQGGRVGGLASVVIEVRMDGVAVEGEPVLVLSEGQYVGAPGEDNAGVIRAVYERIIAKIGGRKYLGAEAPFVAVMAIDGRVPASTLTRVVESARFAGVERLLMLVDDPVAREPWMPRSLPGGASALEDVGFDVVIDVSDEGFDVADSQSRLSVKDLRGLSCAGACASVDAMPWKALDRSLQALAKKAEQPPTVRVFTRQSELPAAALIATVGAAGQQFDVVSLGGLVGAGDGGSIPVTDEPMVAESIKLSGKLVGLSTILPRPSDTEGVAGIPEFEIVRSLKKVAGRTRGCVAQGGSDAVLTVRFEVEDDGTVGAATVTESSVKARGPSQCLLTVIREVTFPKPIGRVPFVVTWDFDATEE